MKKAMKVLLSLTLIVALALTMVACGGGKPEGKYILKSMKLDGKEMPLKEAQKAANMKEDSMYIEFNSNGKGTLCMPDGDEVVPMEFTWKGNTIDMEGDKQDFKLSGKTLTIADGEGNEMVFEKK